MSRIALLLFLLCCRIASAYTYLQVQHPQQTWRYTRGEIKEATLSVRPLGLYMEYGLYLTLAAPANYFTAQDSVEILFYFDLSSQAIVHDLWLWVDNNIMRGQIMDRWQASNIYEGIVKRRRDPALLLKNGNGQYELRVYPLKGGSSRRVKVTWLEPAIWTENSVSAQLPTQLLQVSNTPLAQLQFMFWPAKTWWSPRIPALPSLRFHTTTDSSGAACCMALIPSTAYGKNLYIEMDAPLQQGVWLSNLDLGDEGYYQLAFIPEKVLQAGRSRKMAFLLDYDAARSAQSSVEWVRDVKNQLKRFLPATDSINVIASQLNIRRAGNHWLGADTTSIEAAFKSLGPIPLAGYSNLPSLLKNGIDFVNANGRNGQLILVSNTDQHGDYRVANPLISDLLAAMSPVIPIHVADLLASNPLSYYFNGRYYSGNEYLYLNLCQQTHGQYLSIRSIGSLSETLSQILTVFTKEDQPFDFHMGLQQGFCYQRYDLVGNTTGQYTMNKPILQLGRYQGQPPFVLQASGLAGKQPFTRLLTYSSREVFTADTLLQEMWTGQEIARMEAGTLSNNNINKIVTLSLAERVLSRYTAFLALEPSDKTPVCKQCEDETKNFTRVEREEIFTEEDSLLQSYPNPFNERTTLRLSLLRATAKEDASLAIYNIRGQLVVRYAPPSSALGREWTVHWDGKDGFGRMVSSGTYLAVATVGHKRQTIKIQLLK